MTGSEKVPQKAAIHSIIDTMHTLLETVRVVDSDNRSRSEIDHEFIGYILVSGMQLALHKPEYVQAILQEAKFQLSPEVQWLLDALAEIIPVVGVPVESDK
jgi:hypothetical protein